VDVMTPLENFAGWFPIRFYWREEGPFLDWGYMGEDRFTRPFYDDTVGRRMGNPYTMLFHHHTPVEFLKELNEARPGIPPTGFIFHMSRCGSTLVSQMLAALPQNIVISEAPPIDSILRLNPDMFPRVKRVEWIRGMISSMGQKRFLEEKHYFVKFDSWSTLWLDVVREAFPEVPWIFIYRDPVEVIVSQMRQRGSQMIPGSLGHTLPGVDMAEAWQMPPEEYCGRVLENICEKFLEHADDPNAIAVNYTELPEAVTGRILKHFGIEYSPEDIEKMTATTQFNAKSPKVAFEADSKTKKDEATEAINEIAAARVDPLYERLEAIRLGEKEK
jgi:hypothetical protein